MCLRFHLRAEREEDVVRKKLSGDFFRNPKDMTSGSVDLLGRAIDVVAVTRRIEVHSCGNLVLGVLFHSDIEMNLAVDLLDHVFGDGDIGSAFFSGCKIRIFHKKHLLFIFNVLILRIKITEGHYGEVSYTTLHSLSTLHIFEINCIMHRFTKEPKNAMKNLPAKIFIHNLMGNITKQYGRNKG